MLEGSREAPALARESAKSLLGREESPVSIADGLPWIGIEN